MIKALVGGDCHHTIINPILKIKPWFFFIPYIGAIAIAPYVKTLSAKFYLIPILFNGALKTAPYGDFHA